MRVNAKALSISIMCIGKYSYILYQIILELEKYNLSYLLHHIETFLYDFQHSK